MGSPSSAFAHLARSGALSAHMIRRGDAIASPQTRWRCDKYLISAVLALIHVVVLIGWTVWIVLEVRRKYKGRIGLGFKVSVWEVLRGSA